MIEKIKAIKPFVRRLLTNNLRVRNSDNLLIASIWNREAGGSIATRKMSAFDFLKAFADGKFSSPESIRRSRQLLQQHNEELRGTNDALKQDLADEVRVEIKDIN